MDLATDEALLALLAEAGDGEIVYLLVDLAADAQALSYLTGSQRPAHARCLFEGTNDASAAAAAPWLWPLPDQAPRRRLALSRAVELATRRPCLSAICSRLPMDGLFRRLQRRLDVLLPGEHEILLRYYDPRVLSELPHCLRPALMERFLAVGRRWITVDQRGDACVLHCTSPETDPLTDPLRLDEGEEERLLVLSECNHLAVELDIAAPDAWQQMPSAHRWPWIQRAHSVSQQLGLQSFDDRLRLCLLTLREGEGFETQVRWKERLQPLVEGKATLLQVIESQVQTSSGGTR